MNKISKKRKISDEIEDVKELLTELDELQSEIIIDENEVPEIVEIKNNIKEAFDDLKLKIKENGQKLVKLKMQQEFESYSEFQF